MLALGYLLPMAYLAWSLARGVRAGPNPWRATGLEWQTASPPPTHNFESEPQAPDDVYAYGPEVEAKSSRAAHGAVGLGS